MPLGFALLRFFTQFFEFFCLFGARLAIAFRSLLTVIRLERHWAPPIDCRRLRSGDAPQGIPDAARGTANTPSVRSLRLNRPSASPSFAQPLLPASSTQPVFPPQRAPASRRQSTAAAHP